MGTLRRISPTCYYRPLFLPALKYPARSAKKSAQTQVNDETRERRHSSGKDNAPPQRRSLVVEKSHSTHREVPRGSLQ